MLWVGFASCCLPTSTRFQYIRHSACRGCPRFGVWSVNPAFWTKVPRFWRKRWSLPRWRFWGRCCRLCWREKGWSCRWPCCMPIEPIFQWLLGRYWLAHSRCHIVGGPEHFDLFSGFLAIFLPLLCTLGEWSGHGWLCIPAVPVAPSFAPLYSWGAWFQCPCQGRFVATSRW